MPNIDKRIDISSRIMTLLRERLYNPSINYGQDGIWLISFYYITENGESKKWKIRNDSLISDQWWLDNEPGS